MRKSKHVSESMVFICCVYFHLAISLKGISISYLFCLFFICYHVTLKDLSQKLQYFQKIIYNENAAHNMCDADISLRYI